MKYQKDNIYKLTFLVTGVEEYYKQLKCIYGWHKHEEVGCRIGHLYDSKITKDKPYQNKKVKIELLDIR